MVSIRECYVLEKRGGRSGTWVRPGCEQETAAKEVNHD